MIALRRPRHLVSALVLLLVLFGCASAQPRQNEQQGSDESQRDASKSAALVPGAPPGGSASHENRSDKQPWNWGSIADWAMVLVTLLAVITAICTLRALTSQVAANVNAAKAAKASSDAQMLGERAYIGISHVDGFYKREWGGKDMDPAGRDRYRINLHLINGGRTPATVSGGVFWVAAHLDSRPGPDPAGSPPASVDTAVVPGTYIRAGEYFSKNIRLFLDHSAVEALTDGKLWLIGYVDYTDVFRGRHRAHYCRWIDPQFRLPAKGKAAKNNLVSDSTSARYNIDDDVADES